LYTNRHFRNKKRDYLEDEINECAMNSKNKNIGELLENCFSQLLNVHEVSDVKQTENIQLRN
jgi:hypothetical protein